MSTEAPHPTPSDAGPDADGGAVPGAEQTPRAPRSSSGLVTGMAVVIAALSLALLLVSLMAMRDDKASTSSARETVTVTVTGSGGTAAAQQSPQGAPTPEANVPEKQRSGRLAIARHQANDPLSYGRADAPVTMIEFADLRCPFCAVFSNTIRPELEKYVKDGTLRYEYRDMPLFGDESINAAVAARAAGNQGKYHEYLVALYQAAPPEGGHPPMPKDKLVQFAKDAGVPDVPRFQKEMGDPALRKKVMDDQTYGTSLGISGTPLFVINTQVLSGAQPKDVFEAFIEYEKKHNPSTKSP